MAASFSQWGNDLYTGARSYDIIGKRRLWFTISVVLVVCSFTLLFTKGVTLGIDFTGGSEFNITGVKTTDQQPAIDAVQQVKSDEEPRVSQVGSNALRIQTSELNDQQVEQVTNNLAKAYGIPTSSVSATYIGPSWGSDVSSQALTGLIIFLVLVTIVMALYFRAWRMSVAALIALLHDLVITVGVYALVGWEVTPSTVIGFLTILGYSLYDTVVVFDKVRENTAGVTDQTKYTYGEAANLAVNQTLVRSINTSVVALLPVASILFIGAFLLGAGTLRDISLALFVGIIVGTFSSIFIATPMEVTFRAREKRIRAHTNKVLHLRAEMDHEASPSEALSKLSPIGAIQPGQHLGVSAQPRKRKGSK